MPIRIICLYVDDIYRQICEKLLINLNIILSPIFGHIICLKYLYKQIFVTSLNN